MDHEIVTVVHGKTEGTINSYGVLLLPSDFRISDRRYHKRPLGYSSCIEGRPSRSEEFQ